MCLPCHSAQPVPLGTLALGQDTGKSGGWQCAAGAQGSVAGEANAKMASDTDTAFVLGLKSVFPISYHEDFKQHCWDFKGEFCPMGFLAPSTACTCTVSSVTHLARGDIKATQNRSN